VLVKLLKQHVIDGVLHERDEVLDVNVVTPFMEGLDPVARDSIETEKRRVWGRWLDPQRTRLLDNPPIPRPDGEEQPVPHVPSQGPPR
jgi:hypothetical protein